MAERPARKPLTRRQLGKVIADLRAAMNPEPQSPHPSWRDGLRRPWYQR